MFEKGRDYRFTWKSGTDERLEVWQVLDQQGPVVKARNAFGETKHINTAHSDFFEAKLLPLKEEN